MGVTLCDRSKLESQLFPALLDKHTELTVSSEHKVKHTLGAKFSKECLSSL